MASAATDRFLTDDALRVMAAEVAAMESRRREVPRSARDVVDQLVRSSFDGRITLSTVRAAALDAPSRLKALELLDEVQRCGLLSPAEEPGLHQVAHEVHHRFDRKAEREQMRSSRQIFDSFGDPFGDHYRAEVPLLHRSVREIQETYKRRGRGSTSLEDLLEAMRVRMVEHEETLDELRGKHLARVTALESENHRLKQALASLQSQHDDLRSEVDSMQG